MVERLFFPSTWHTLDEVSHHGTEVSPDVLEDLGVFVILSLQEQPRQIHILQEQGTQCQGVTLQCSVGATDKEKERLSLQKPSFIFDKELYMCILTATVCEQV